MIFNTNFLLECVILKNRWKTNHKKSGLLLIKLGVFTERKTEFKVEGNNPNIKKKMFFNRKEDSKLDSQ